MTARAPLLSAQWHRVAALRPRLDPAARVERVVYRRDIWHVLVRADGSRSFRLNAAAYAFVGRCHGELTAQRLWELVLAETGDDAPTQDELLHLMARLNAAALVSFDRRVDASFQALGSKSANGDTPSSPPAGNSLLSFRIPLGRPDRWLGRLSEHTRWLFEPLTLIVWALVVCSGLVAAWLNIGPLTAHARTWGDTPRMLMLLWLAYPAVKLLHELAHALAVKHWGGKVAEWGITVMMFTPVPYVDASAASAFSKPSQRALVSAAGILVELFLASTALLIGLNVQPGPVQDLSFAVFFIGSVSTLLVNGNPLLRFDGYYVLTDLLGLPNLASRSARHWQERLRERLLGLHVEHGIEPAAGERRWLWGYAPAAWAYRLALGIAIIGWLGGVSFLFGAAIAIYFGWALFVKPLWRSLRFVQACTRLEADRGRVLLRASFAASAAAGLFAFLPLPFSSVVQGVVWLPERSLVRAETEGFIEAVHLADGEPVRAGQVLFTLQSPDLLAERARLESRITALETERYQNLRADPSRAMALGHELDSAQAELSRIEERVSQLQVRAGIDGVGVVTRAGDLPGRFVRQGALLAHVLTPESTIVRVAIPHEQAVLVQTRSRGVSVRLVDGTSALPGELLRDVAGTVTQLATAALGDRSGGRIVTDPRDERGLVPRQGVAQADVRLHASAGQRFGGRAWVRFDHGHAPLAVQLARRMQQLLLKHFNPAE